MEHDEQDSHQTPRTVAVSAVKGQAVGQNGFTSARGLRHCPTWTHTLTGTHSRAPHTRNYIPALQRMERG